ncbi:thiamine-phosphate kinase [Microbacterium protaetiae]|uniref:Thiamine-monophosphate kinase n=1 Tax=Microbacterium protaetiae TaxID=2509458 RepID=A0A4V0YDL4_9MICO|nr:thiamine-phosphate kinase [Microbacterium protaetiae]QAY61121.1 thiamine-phosphate kinase [Microbacterium protaetiae]
MANQVQTVGELGEARVLAAILDRIGSSTAIVGPGDDAAVLDAASGRIVATVDTLVHGPDFRLAWSSGYDLGWKSAAVNLADIAAMGARPTALLVALTLPDETPLSLVTAMADGLRDACAALAPGCAVQGGDLAVSPTLTIAVTALGVLDGVEPVRRSGARPGDIVALAGDVGRAAAGLTLLFGRFRDAAGTPIPVEATALSEVEAHAVAAQLRPAPPIVLGPAAARAGATAMMDVSDGLALDASRLAAASGVAVDFDASALGADPVAALAGGEDHALLATFRPATALPVGFRRIGAVRAAAGAGVLVDGRPYDDGAGWDPYRGWDAAQG